jgi:hypothetical protein
MFKILNSVVLRKDLSSSIVFLSTLTYECIVAIRTGNITKRVFLKSTSGTAFTDTKHSKVELANSCFE